MSKNNSLNNSQEDYYKSLNKIMILGLTGMAALGTSMLFIESTKTDASPLFRVNKLLKFSNDVRNIKRLPALIPKRANIIAIPSLNKLKLNKTVSTGAALSEMTKKYLTQPFKPSPTIVKTESKKQLKPRNSPH